MSGVVILDYGVGNLRNVQKIFEKAGEKAVVSADPAAVGVARAVVLPGVGAFKDAIAKLRASGLVEPLLAAARDGGKPVLGICLGMQLLARSSEEDGRHEGLGLIAGDARRLDAERHGLRIPHMGWNGVRVRKPSRLFDGIAEDTDFYFAHSYALHCDDPGDVAATTDYGGEVTVAVEKDNVFAAQFHPEKSQDAGKRMIVNFLSATIR